MKTPRILRTLYAAGLAAFLTTGTAVFADSKADVILTIGGDIASDPAKKVHLDLDALAKLPTVEFSTTTIWTEGLQTFTGVSLHSLMQMLDVQSGTLRAFAVNDYAVEIPVADAVPNGPIVAYLHNGKEMSLRDKGPLWIVYPFDDGTRYKSQTYYARSIWQLDRIDVISAP